MRQIRHIEGRKMKLLLVDDHPLFCDAMAMTVEEIFENPTVLTASNLIEALEIVSDHEHFDFIVLDLNLPDVDGLDGLIRLKLQSPHSKIVVVSSLSDNRITASVLEAGAIGFVPKDSSRALLITAFQNMVEGQIYTPDDFHKPSKRAMDEEHHQILKRIESLTPQQANILALICQGKLNKQIAFELSIVETTVKAHLTAILRKLGVQNRTQAVLLAKKVSYAAITQSTE